MAIIHDITHKSLEPPRESQGNDAPARLDIIHRSLESEGQKKMYINRTV